MPALPFAQGPVDIDALTRWLEALPPPQRIRACRLLADRATQGVLAATADAQIYALTRELPHRQAAEQLGLTLPQVRRAIRDHNLRHTDGSAPTPSAEE